MTDNVIDLRQRALLNAALSYAQIGWHVLPLWGVIQKDGGYRCACGKSDCSKPGKHPHTFLAPHGQAAATTDARTITGWFERGRNLNIGVQLSRSGLVAIDIDPRNGGYVTIEQIESQHGALASDVTQYTGGGGEHRVFSAPVLQSLPGKLGPGIDVKLNGYIAVEPSTHISGIEYAWESSGDPREGASPSPLPDWIRDLSHQRAPALPDAPAAGSRYVTEAQIDELRSALSAIPADEYETWIKVGMALRSIGGAGFGLWDQWSQSSAKYRPDEMGAKWRSFGPSGGLEYETVFHLAQQAGWVNPLAGSAQIIAPAPIESVKIRTPDPEPGPPAEIQRLPGILGTVYDWIESTARKPQPAFSTQAALAFGATVLGRRYRTTAGNWPSLYFLNIGKSASGKEHAKWALEQLLEACDLSHLIGPAGYTSDSGVLSALHRTPSHVAVIDEFGKVLESASVKHGARAASAMRALMEAWGRCDGTLRSQGYSTFGMSDADAKTLERTVHNPALTLLAMTTPEAFFESVGSAAARDGFLNRFLIVETDIGRQSGRMTVDIEIPESIVDWAARARTCPLVAANDDPSLRAAAREIPISAPARELFAAFESECIALMDSHEKHGLAEMFGRCNEMSMRVALVIALGCDSESIDSQHAAWAIDYVRHHSTRTATRLITAVADSAFEAVSNQVLQAIQASNPRGMTERELSQACRKYRGLDPRGRASVLQGMVNTGDIMLAEFPPSARGKVRKAWVAVEPDDA